MSCAKCAVTDEGDIPDFCRRVAFWWCISSLVIGLHINESSVVVNSIVPEQDVFHNATTCERCLEVQSRTPPTTIILTVPCLTDSNLVVIDFHIPYAPAHFTANGNPHANSEDVIAHGDILCEIFTACELWIRTVVGGRRTAHSGLDRNMVISTADIVVLNHYIPGTIRIDTIRVGGIHA